MSASHPKPTGRLRLQGCEVDLETRRVRRGASSERLTTREAGLIEYLLAHAGQLVPR